MDDLQDRHDLTDGEWQRLGPLLSAHPRQGRHWNDHRTVIDGILFRIRAGCPWRDLPAQFGNWKTVYERHRRWSLDGTWERIPDALRAGCDAAEGRDWTVSADSTVVRAHQHAAGARRARPAELARGAASNDKNPPTQQAGREALGRSRGGLSGWPRYRPSQPRTGRAG